VGFVGYVCVYVVGVIAELLSLQKTQSDAYDFLREQSL
jgi:hypothetical protein